MRLLCLDPESNGLDFLMRCQAAGHDVQWYDKTRDDGSRPRAGEGIIPKIEDFNQVKRKWLDWADLIWLPDNTCYVGMLEPYRLTGYPIFGPGLDAVQWELNRTAGQQAMQKAGLKIVDCVEFHDYKSAIRYVEKEGRVFVSKHSGLVGEKNKARSYVAKSVDELIYMLERWDSNPDYRKEAKEQGFILQEKVDGVEMAVGGWFGPGGWSQWFLENFEHKKLIPGDLGPNTGEMGTMARYVKHSKLANQILLPMTDQLKRMRYVGYIDNNAIIQDDGTPRPLEFTMRDGWPLRHNICALHHGDPAQWMLDLLKGKDTIDVTNGEVSISVLVALPPFPTPNVIGKELDGIPIYDADDFDHVHLCEVRMGDAVPTMVNDQLVRIPGYVTTGEYVAVVTGTGATISGARRSAYAAVKRIRIPNDPFYRLDIGSPRRLREGIPQIQKHGYAKGLTL